MAKRIKESQIVSGMCESALPAETPPAPVLIQATESVAKELIANAPEISDSAEQVAEVIKSVDQDDQTSFVETPPASTPPVVPTTIIDDTVFDPSVHAVDEAGNPRKNLDGTFSRKRGRKPGSKNSASTPVMVAPINEMACEQAAKDTVGLMVFVAITIGGEAFVPGTSITGENENEMLTRSFSTYYKAAGIISMPPWLTLLTGIGMYVAPRVNDPRVKARFAAMRDKIMGRKTNVETVE